MHMSSAILLYSFVSGTQATPVAFYQQLALNFIHSLSLFRRSSVYLLCSALSPATTYSYSVWRHQAISFFSLFALRYAWRSMLENWCFQLWLWHVLAQFTFQFSRRLLVATCGSVADFCSGSGSPILSLSHSLAVWPNSTRLSRASLCLCKCLYIYIHWSCVSVIRVFNKQIHRQVVQIFRQTGGQADGRTNWNSFPLRWRLHFSCVVIAVAVAVVVAAAVVADFSLV